VPVRLVADYPVRIGEVTDCLLGVRVRLTRQANLGGLDPSSCPAADVITSLSGVQGSCESGFGRVPDVFTAQLKSGRDVVVRSASISTESL
jgi:hypothetical protein